MIDMLCFFIDILLELFGEYFVWDKEGSNKGGEDRGIMTIESD